MNATAKKSLLRVAFTSNATAQQPPLNGATDNATTTQHPTDKPASLLDLARNKLRNNHAISSQKDAQQDHLKQGEDVARNDEQIDDAQVVRHQRVLSMLETDPDKRYSLLSDDVTSDPVIVTIGIRGLAAFDMQIPKKNYDGLALLQVLDQYSGDTEPLPKAEERSHALPGKQGKAA